MELGKWFFMKFKVAKFKNLILSIFLGGTLTASFLGAGRFCCHAADADGINQSYIQDFDAQIFNPDFNSERVFGMFDVYVLNMGSEKFTRDDLDKLKNSLACADMVLTSYSDEAMKYESGESVGNFIHNKYITSSFCAQLNEIKGKLKKKIEEVENYLNVGNSLPVQQQQPDFGASFQPVVASFQPVQQVVVSQVADPQPMAMAGTATKSDQQGFGSPMPPVEVQTVNETQSFATAGQPVFESQPVQPVVDPPVNETQPFVTAEQPVFGAPPNQSVADQPVQVSPVVARPENEFSVVQPEQSGNMGLDSSQQGVGSGASKKVVASVSESKSDESTEAVSNFVEQQQQDVGNSALVKKVRPVVVQNEQKPRQLNNDYGPSEFVKPGVEGSLTPGYGVAPQRVQKSSVNLSKNFNQMEEPGLSFKKQVAMNNVDLGYMKAPNQNFVSENVKKKFLKNVKQQQVFDNSVNKDVAKFGDYSKFDYVDKKKQQKVEQPAVSDDSEGDDTTIEDEMEALAKADRGLVIVKMFFNCIYGFLSEFEKICSAGGVGIFTKAFKEDLSKLKAAFTVGALKRSVGAMKRIVKKLKAARKYLARFRRSKFTRQLNEVLNSKIIPVFERGAYSKLLAEMESMEIDSVGVDVKGFKSLDFDITNVLKGEFSSILEKLYTILKERRDTLMKIRKKKIKAKKFKNKDKKSNFKAKKPKVKK